MKLKNAIAGSVCMSLFSFSVLASADYVCTVLYQPGSTIRGSGGNVAFITTTGPGCGGAVVIDNGELCSPTPTSSQCVNDSIDWYSSAALLVMLDMLRNAAHTNQQLSVRTEPCIGGSGLCPSEIIF